MKIATWNVNSLKVRLPHVLQWLSSESPDILALQETKLTDDNFPHEAINSAGYQVSYSGQKTYNGVAILSKQAQQDIITDISGLDDPQRRILAATVEGVRVLNLYVVNGAEVGSEKYAYKLDWLNKVTCFIQSEQAKHAHYVVLGDFNIAPEDRDVHDPDLWKDKILCSQAERAALNNITALGFVDVYRLFEQADKSFSWWDYRAAGFRRNAGLRIDLILADQQTSRQCTACAIDKEPRAWERPSDHAPVWAEFSLQDR